MGNIAVENPRIEPRLRGNDGRYWSGELSDEYASGFDPEIRDVKEDLLVGLPRYREKRSSALPPK
jgi:hypothetical protein